MCGRYSLTSKLDNLQARFDFEAENLAYRPRYNVAPTQEVLAVVNDGQNRAGFLRWGLVPFWAKDTRIGSRMINVRAETVAEKPAFRQALRKRRCLVLADGFYEWKKEGAAKVPMYIASRSGEPFGMAGLWGTWKAPSGEPLHSCTIITTAANSLMEPIHDRMPVILTRETEAAWLDRSIDDPVALTHLLAPYPAPELEAYPVSTLVNSPRNDAPECILPAG